MPHWEYPSERLLSSLSANQTFASNSINLKIICRKKMLTALCTFCTEFFLKLLLHSVQKKSVAWKTDGTIQKIKMLYQESNFNSSSHFWHCFTDIDLHFRTMSLYSHFLHATISVHCRRLWWTWIAGILNTQTIYFRFRFFETRSQRWTCHWSVHCWTIRNTC